MESPNFVNLSNYSISEQIQFCEESIDCLKSRLSFYRKRLKILRSLLECELKPITAEESNNGN